MMKLGDMKLFGVNGIDSFSSSTEANYVQHALIEGKPRLQRVGTNLETLTITFKLNALYCVPEEELTKWYELLNDSKVQYLTNQAGDYYGNFVVKSLKHDIIKQSSEGKIHHTEVTIELLESGEPNTSIRKSNQSFAVGNIPGAPKAKIVETPYGAAQETNANITAVSAESQAVSDLIVSVNNNPDTADLVLASAEKRTQTIAGYLDQINTEINNTQSTIYAAAASLRTHMSVIQGALSVLENACNTVDIAGAVAADAAYQTTVTDFKRYSLPILILSATRR